MEHLTRDKISLAFEDAGKGAPPLLLIHDLGCDHASLRPQLEHFRGRHRVVAVDLPGHGQSDQLPRAYTLASFAEDLAWLCYELGVYRPVAVGHRMGGAIAVELAAGYPDLLAAVVALDVPLLANSRTCAQDVVAQIGTSAHGEAMCQSERRDVPTTSDLGKERFVEAFTTSLRLAATWENTIARDGTPAMARCVVPMLCVQTGTARADLDRLRKLCPHVVVESVQVANLSQCEPAHQVNAMIDAFLAISSVQK